MGHQRQQTLLRTANYRACVEFYRYLVELPLRRGRQQSGRTCFDIGGVDLVVEAGPATGREPLRLDFTVRDVAKAAGELNACGVPCRLQETADGPTAEFRDPDGNLCRIHART